LKNQILVEKLLIGGINQWISIMGNSKKDLCLFLHGGPGFAEMPIFNSFCEDLANDLLIVTWDQRGAGKSYSPFIKADSMNLDQFISDAFEVICHLKTRFNKEKIYLIGHSWGSALGILLVQKYPQHFHAYIGVGQIGNWAKGETLSYQFTLNEAKRLNKKSAIRKLYKVGYPPFNWKKVITQRQLLLKLGGSLYLKNNYNELIYRFVFSEEYSILDLVKLLLGLRFSLKNLWYGFTKINLLEKVPEVQVPVFFLLGKHDYQVPFQASVEYFEHIKAPKKELFWFEKSGHTPMYEETEKFIKTIQQITKNR
jgi:pimeloyl-ACP methyl ester carboxylesterase